jgi:hypothetical protein
MCTEEQVQLRQSHLESPSKVVQLLNRPRFNVHNVRDTNKSLQARDPPRKPRKAKQVQHLIIGT